MSEIIIKNIFNEINVKIDEEIKRNITHFHVFRDLGNRINIILITNEEKVYCYGHNSSGILGFGHDKNVNEFTVNEELSDKSIIDFKNSEFHTIARTRDGKLYCWGRSNHLGNGGYDWKISKPQLNEYLMKENIVEMCCGYDYTLVLTSKKEVYAWGDNDYGQIGDRGNYNYKPFKLNYLNEEKIKAISCGYCHSMVLTESGRVYSWGQSSEYQLGINYGNEKEYKPERIKIVVKIKKISCGKDHSLLLSDEGDIYVIGRYEYKRLGLEINEKKQLTPIKLNHLKKFIDISSHYCYNISAALSENGLYYVWDDCGEKVNIIEPKETQLNSFDEIFAMQDNNTLLKTGKYIEDWIELRKLGAGSYGTVYEVKSKFGGYNFAIKKISLLERNSSKKDLWKEFQNSLLIGELDSEFLVKYIDIWIENDFQLINGFRKYDNNSTLYIQMDLCDKTLSDINEEIKEDSKLYINNSFTHLSYYFLSGMFIEILKGVNYLHKNNIIHRDLHPGNILVKWRINNYCIQIGDFGLAKVHDNNKPNTGDIGHVQYSAPEVLDSEYYDMRADIYSLGVVLQHVFDIDSDNLYNGNQISLLMGKLKNLRDLSIKMTTENYKERKNCEQILEEKENWALNESEFIYKEELNILSGISRENMSYVENMIFSKLSFYDLYKAKYHHNIKNTGDIIGKER